MLSEQERQTLQSLLSHLLQSDIEVGELRVERDNLRHDIREQAQAFGAKVDALSDIVRELAESGPHWDRYDRCSFCGGLVPEKLMEHKPDCLWRRAKEMQDAE